MKGGRFHFEMLEPFNSQRIPGIDFNLKSPEKKIFKISIKKRLKCFFLCIKIDNIAARCLKVNGV